MQYKRLFLTITFLLNFLLISFAQEPTLLEHGGGVRAVEFSPVDASLVASAGESNIIKLWNLQNNTVRTLRGHTGIVNSIAFSPNGELLASVSDDRTIKLWNVRNQQNVRTLQDGTPYRSVAFSPDGRVFATAGGHHVTIWDLPNRMEIARLDHNRAVRAVAFSPDGQLLAVGENVGEGPASVKVWDVQRRQVVVRLTANPKSVKSIEFSFDNRYMAASGWNGHLKVWDVSNWELLRTIPNIGHYDIAFSPDGKMLAGTNGNGYVSLWWVEDGTRVARLPGPTEYRHPVDFSLDGAYLAVGAEDGLLRIWQMDTSLEGQNTGGIRILHVDTYHQQLGTAKSAAMNNIPDPVPPPAIVREYFQLDPFYEQWINVGGLPVIASAKVNPYALKEAAWLILKMIGHRPDVLRTMAGNKARFSVIAHTEIITEIPEYRSDPRPDFLVFRERGWGGSLGATVSTSEEDILNYPDSFAIRYEALLHELAHGIHRLGLNTLDPRFDERLRVTYEGAMKKGLWQGTYASSDRREYWAEASHAWFHPNGAGSFDRFGNTRQALKQYDPGLATLLAEVYGDKDWQYTPVETRTHQPHLQGFNPKDSPTFGGWPELAALYRQLRTDPSSDGGGEWVNLDPYKPNQLSRLAKSNVIGDLTTVVFVNFTQADVLLYEVTSAGTERYWSRCAPGRTRGRPTRINRIWLIKDLDGGNIAVFQAEEKIGRAAIGAATNKTNQTSSLPSLKAKENVTDNNSEPQVLISQFQRPPMYWMDAEAGTLHRLVGEKVENLIPSVQNAASLAVNMMSEELYWTEKTSNKTGRIRRANLDGTNVQIVKDLTSVPHSIAIDPANDKLYLTNSWGKIQRINLDGSDFEPNLITGLNAPKHLALDVAGGKLYWTETEGRIRRANLNGSNTQTIATGLRTLGGIAVANGNLYWTEQNSESAGRVQRVNLDGSSVQTLSSLQSVPLGIAIDATGRKLYWTNSRGKIQRADLNGSNVQNLITGLDAPAGITLGIIRVKVVTAEASLDKITGPWLWMIAPTKAGQGGANSTNVDSLFEASSGKITEANVAVNGAAEGDTVGDLVWTLGEIAPTGGNNVTNLINQIGLGKGDVDDHSIYGLITLESTTAQSGVTMRTGSNDSIKIWLNGEVVHNNPINRGAEDFHDTFKVNLVAGDNLLLVKVSERSERWSMFVGIDADVNAVYKRPLDPVASEDVNSDGIINILDLVSVSANFGKTGQNPADVNRDGVVNIVDLVKVAGEMGAGVAAPSAHPHALEMFTAADVRQWLTQAQHLDLTDATSRRGILLLEQLVAALVPKETSLLPNYPNPFNPETWVPYQLSEPAEVTLHIYSVNGTLVRTLALGHQPAGMYHNKNRAAYWDGKNEIGEAVASGLYFYTLSAGDFTLTRKMLIRK